MEHFWKRWTGRFAASPNTPYWKGVPRTKEQNTRIVTEFLPPSDFHVTPGFIYRKVNGRKRESDRRRPRGEPTRQECCEGLSSPQLLIMHKFSNRYFSNCQVASPSCRNLPIAALVREKGKMADESGMSPFRETGGCDGNTPREWTLPEPSMQPGLVTSEFRRVGMSAIVC